MCPTMGASVSFHHHSTRFVPGVFTDGTRRPCHPRDANAATNSQDGGRRRSTSRICFQGCRGMGRRCQWLAERRGRRGPIWLGRPHRRPSAYQGEAGPADIRRCCRMAIGKIERCLTRLVPPAAGSGCTGARQWIEGPSRCQHAPEMALDSQMSRCFEAPGHA